MGEEWYLVEFPFTFSLFGMLHMFKGHFITLFCELFVYDFRSSSRSIFWSNFLQFLNALWLLNSIPYLLMLDIFSQITPFVL